MVLLVLVAAIVVVAGLAAVFDRRARKRGRGTGDLSVLNSARDGADASMSHAQLNAQVQHDGGVGLGGLG